LNQNRWHGRPSAGASPHRAEDPPNQIWYHPSFCILLILFIHVNSSAINRRQNVGVRENSRHQSGLNPRAVNTLRTTPRTPTNGIRKTPACGFPEPWAHYEPRPGLSPPAARGRSLQAQRASRLHSPARRVGSHAPTRPSRANGPAIPFVIKRPALTLSMRRMEQTAGPLALRGSSCRTITQAVGLG
jgi:hypothetical protein